MSIPCCASTSQSTRNADVDERGLRNTRAVTDLSWNSRVRTIPTCLVADRAFEGIVHNHNTVLVSCCGGVEMRRNVHEDLARTNHIETIQLVQGLRGFPHAWFSSSSISACRSSKLAGQWVECSGTTYHSS